MDVESKLFADREIDHVERDNDWHSELNDLGDEIQVTLEV